MKSWWQLSGALLAAVGLAAVFGFAIPAAGQTQGYNAICNSSQCSTTSELTGSSAFIDASAYGSTTANFCGVIHTILTNTHLSPPFVIDARGLPGTTGTSMTCSASPWAGISNPPGSVILLPAGTIITSAPWVLPSNTKLIGTARGSGTIGTTNYGFETTIQASTTLSGAVVQFGNSTYCPSGCQGISLEHLTINGGYTMNGIENDYCGVQCYVQHVTLYQVLGTGLKVGGVNASDSGPYSNITFDLAGLTPQSGTACAQIIQTSGTRGIHGLTCSASPDATNGVLLDASNNSIEDVRIIGFYNGVVVGSNAQANSNVLLNIYGDTVGSLLYPVNLIEIAGNGRVKDLSITAVANAAGSVDTTTINDLATSTALNDPFIGMYVVGEPNTSGTGYTRFSTATTAGATWLFGQGSPSSSPCNMGSLYSDASAGHLWVCKLQNGNLAWAEVI